MVRVVIDTTEAWSSKCELAHLGGCDRGKLIRHHMGNDGLLAVRCPAIREQYAQFLDCARICNAHHMRVHYLYDLYRHEIFGSKGFLMLTQGQLHEARAAFIKLFFQIRSQEVKLQKVSKEFRLKWKEGHKEWQKKQKHH